jgi:hypothetical protein
MNNSEQQQFLPKYESARIAVERARAIVRDNNEMIARLKNESNIDENIDNNPFYEAENFSPDNSYAFDLYKIKSTNGITDFFKDIFGVH